MTPEVLEEGVTRVTGVQATDDAEVHHTPPVTPVVLAPTEF